MSSYKDNIFTVPLPNSNLVFTRYLYLKDEVKISMLISILNKRDDSIFRAYELYYSGFKRELIEFIWIIYYDFFASLNPSYEAYLIKKQTMLLNETDNSSIIISGIIQDLCDREYNTDIFMLRQVFGLFEIDSANPPKTLDELGDQLSAWTEAKDYFQLANFIMTNSTLFSEFEILLMLNANSRTLKGLTAAINNINIISNSDKISPKTILLGKVFAFLTPSEKQVRTYAKAELHDIMIYDTLSVSDEIRAYRILKHACICGVDDLQHLQLFTLERQSQSAGNLHKIYSEKWLYHASFSPVWSKRIQEHRGYVDYIKQEVQFINEECKEQFDELYDYEPDEQSKIVKKNALEINTNTNTNTNNWKHFIEKYGALNKVKMGVDDYLDALSEEKLKYTY